MSISDYRFYLNEAFNIVSLELNGTQQYEFETDGDVAERAESEYELRLKSGKW